MRLNLSDLIKGGEDEFSKHWFMNANQPYCTIYTADTYQDQCVDPSVKKDIDKTQCIIKDSNRLTSGESFDYVFEEENKALKSVLGPNPTFDDFRVATLVKDEAQNIVKEVKKRYKVRTNLSSEAGLPNYKECVQTVRKVFRLFVSKPKSKKNLQSLTGELLNSKLVKEFDVEALRRRKLYMEEIKIHGKFTKAPHSEKKFQITMYKSTFQEKNKEALKMISEEEDAEKRCVLLKSLHEIALIEDKDKKLNEIINFVDNIDSEN